VDELNNKNSQPSPMQEDNHPEQAGEIRVYERPNRLTSKLLPVLIFVVLAILATMLIFYVVR
jgi:hypothetical protein